jgi:hypothetical protein
MRVPGQSEPWPFILEECNPIAAALKAPLAVQRKERRV